MPESKDVLKKRRSKTARVSEGHRSQPERSQQPAPDDFERPT